MNARIDEHIDQAIQIYQGLRIQWKADLADQTTEENTKLQAHIEILNFLLQTMIVLIRSGSLDPTSKANLLQEYDDCNKILVSLAKEDMESICF